MSSSTDVALIVESDIAIRTAGTVAFGRFSLLYTPYVQVDNVSSAILYYDFALTVDTEIERFWGRPWSLVSFGFYLNRYLSLIGHIPVMYELYASMAQSLCFLDAFARCSIRIFDNISRCFELQMYHQLLAGVTQVIVGVMQVFRVYALYSGSRQVLLLLVGLVIMGCAISGWAIGQTWHVHRSYLVNVPERIGCDLTMSQAQGEYLAAVWACVLVFDFVVFVLTLYRVLKVGRKWRGSVFTLMLRDGTLYFGVLFVCHLGNILTCLLAQPAYRGITVTTTNVIATSLIARLMLNIRDSEFSGRQYRWPSDGMVV
ncbi:hypothetical protein K466DRAFT_603726 [Polyporus arcularius HHB13444]|uniref:DUF6533 domain-containing protein n=1 Tax=Polyporus arcularius HHB13444 TaxID=1314778 RepID=A0A5C3P1B8_9APHY|nr:hypothetical protein K466DRAFT_603726 [Polyporus arcularius HHB13444]